VGAIVGITLMLIRGQRHSAPIAFGPFLAGAGWLVLMYGRPLVAGYLGFFPHP